MNIEREIHLLSNIPDILNYNRILYVGAKHKRMECSSLFREKIKNLKMDLVEPFEENYLYLTKLDWVNEVFNSTIQEFNPNKKYEIVFWWHGPEHIEKEELKSTLKHIESFTENYVVLGCPWGKNKQGIVGGNEYEEHKSYLYEENFSCLGYNVSTHGDKDIKGSHMLVWKKINC